MVTANEDYAIFQQLRRLKPSQRELKPILSDDAKAALEKRKEKLQREQDIRAYNKMVSNVVREKKFKEDEYGQIWKEMTRQGTAVFNTLITVGGAFTFAFYGMQLMYSGIDLQSRIFAGLIVGGIVFIADLYFIMKGM